MDHSDLGGIPLHRLPRSSRIASSRRPSRQNHVRFCRAPREGMNRSRHMEGILRGFDSRRLHQIAKLQGNSVRAGGTIHSPSRTYCVGQLVDFPVRVHVAVVWIEACPSTSGSRSGRRKRRGRADRRCALVHPFTAGRSRRDDPVRGQLERVGRSVRPGDPGDEGAASEGLASGDSVFADVGELVEREHSRARSFTSSGRARSSRWASAWAPTVRTMLATP